MTKVLLTLCNSPMDNLIPLGTSLLSSCLKQAGHEVRLFDTTFYRTREHTGSEARVETLQVTPLNLANYGIRYKDGDVGDDFRKTIEEFNPKLIGLSAVEITYPIAKILLESIRDINIPKIVGGIHATLARDEVIEEDSLDMICVGEGEEAIVELADRLQRGQDYSDVKNLWVKKNGRIIKNPLRPLVNLDELPFQDWDIYERERFFKPMGDKVWVMGNVEVNRSCTNRCTYCANDALHKVYHDQGRYYRERSIEAVVREVEYLTKKHGLQYLYFIAENFLAMSDERFEKFVKLYRNIKVPFYIDTRPETLTPEKVKAIEGLGCDRIAMGIESGDPDFRKRMLRRYMSNETIIEAGRKVKANSKISLSVNNIIGFPTETREQVFQTIELNREIPSDSVMVNIFSPYHGTELRDVAIEKGYMTSEILGGDYRTDYVINMPHLPPDELRGLRRTFVMYVKFQKEMWPEIERAERFDEEGNRTFQKLSEEYRKRFM